MSIKTSYLKRYIGFILVSTIALAQCAQKTESADETVLAESSEYSDITCPKCGHTETEKLPTEVCQLKYECKNCGHEMTPEDDDCCVFCTHGTHQCPSMQ